MNTTTLGRTGLEATVLGLGCGGYSKLGRALERSDEHARAVVRRALALGINLIDTASSYGTEPHVGQVVAEWGREKVILCSKTGTGGEHFRTPQRLRAAVEESLRNLRTDVIDVYEMHGVPADLYPRVEAEHLPVLEAMKREGKIRFVGITEAFETDTSHAMLRMAAACEAWDVMMVGFNLLNTSARRSVFPASRQNGAGILGMFAVRHALVSQENLRPVLRRLAEAGEIPADEVDLEHPLGFLLDEADSLPEAAYRYCIHDPDIHVTLSGTGDIAHLEANVAAANKPPLSEEACAKLDKIFAAVESESAKSPRRSW